ncbi:MAG: hypothetical protein V4609_19045 [Pseudomonadota bacterium]
MLRTGRELRQQLGAGPAVALRNPREHKGSLPSEAQVRKAVDLFCSNGITDEAAASLKKLVLSHSHRQSGGRRIHAPQLEAIARPFVANFERMCAASSRGPGVLSQVIAEVEEALGGGDAAIDQVAGPLLDMIPSSAALNRAERIALPSAMVQAALGGIDAMQAPDRGLQLLRQRLYQSANWGECADWITSLFRGAIRALQPDSAAGAAIARLEVRHFIASQATRIPPAALAPAVFGMLEGLAGAAAFDSREQAMSLVRELEHRLTPAQLGALCRGVVRHLCVPARAHTKTVQWLLLHAASGSLDPRRQLAVGLAVGSQLASHGLTARLQSTDKSQASWSAELAQDDVPDRWIALGLRVGGDPQRILDADLPSREGADLLVLAWEIEAADGRAPAREDLRAIAESALSLDDTASALGRILPLCQGYPCARLLAAAREGLLAKVFEPRGRMAESKAQDEPRSPVAGGPQESSAAAALRDESALHRAFEALYRLVIEATAQLRTGRRGDGAKALDAYQAGVEAMQTMVTAELEAVTGGAPGAARPFDAHPRLKSEVAGWLRAYLVAAETALADEGDEPSKVTAVPSSPGPLEQLSSLFHAWLSR